MSTMRSVPGGFSGGTATDRPRTHPADAASRRAAPDRVDAGSGTGT
ncbi:hypothetical protein CZ771_00590 [Actinomycetales bacterium JB111]|nr:hypothetical protein CZ771_00590 [Actinomycetales bacterium JB111]